MDWIISGIAGLLIGGFFGVFAMAVLSGRAYDKGRKDADQGNYLEGFKVGYSAAYDDIEFVNALAAKQGDEVVFRGPDHTKIEGD